MSRQFNNFYEKCDKTIETSKKIESLYQELANIEFSYGRDSNEYIMLSKIISSTSLSEYNDIKRFIESPYADYFKRYISLSKCDRLIDIINDDYEIVKSILEKSNEKTELDHHKLCKSLFNLIQSKSYIKILDMYIDKEKNSEIKKFLIDEKYDIIERNNSLQNWYFGFDNTCLLIESDFLSSLEVEVKENEYVKLKNNYYINVFSNFLNLVYSAKLDNMEKIIYETNIYSLLLSMNNEYTFETLCELKDDIRICLTSSRTKKFIDNIYRSYPSIERKVKVKCRNEEVI